MTQTTNPNGSKRIGLVLSGGGARAAYQVGVLKAIADILPAGSPNPFQIICGTSAGALNAAGLATHAHCLRDGVRHLESVWANFQGNQVYRTDYPGVIACAGKWVLTLMFGRLERRGGVSLLDNRPLRRLLEETLDLDRIPAMIADGFLRALCITASGYTSGESVSFFQGATDLAPWARSRRIGIRAQISVEHLMASSAIPVLFPAVRVHREYFGDGAVRQLAPVSPALHLGADKVLIVGVGGNRQRRPRERVEVSPSIAQIIGHVMNSAFVDSLEGDIERVTRINRTIGMIPDETRQQHGLELRPIDLTVITPPTQVLDTIAMQHRDELPKSIRWFVRGSGATQRSGSGVLSYLLFEASYCRNLMELGYHDAMTRREELEAFLMPPAPVVAPTESPAADTTASAAPKLTSVPRSA